LFIIIALLIALIPAIAVLYPFIKGNAANEWLDDESSPMADLERRWDSAISGIKSAELENSIGNLEEDDYTWLRQEYMREAALVMRSMELEEEQEAELLAAIEVEIREVKERISGTDGPPDDSQASQGPASSV
jgi:hypothetical protein